MDTPKIASLGNIPDNNGFFVCRKLEKMRGKVFSPPSIPQRVRSLYSSAVKL
jgi:hypothetical protein